MRILTALVAAVALAAPVFAQQQELVEEVAARVNADVITRSQYMQALKETEQDFKQNFKGADADTKFAEFRPKILDAMIDNLLLVQKGQELGLDVDAQINQQFTRLAREQNMSITEFEEAMKKTGLEPADARARLREKLMRDEVLNGQVYQTVWRGLTEKEKREFYEKNKERFMQAGELKLSEMFITVEGRSFSEIEAKARDIVAQARGGAAFADLVKKNGDATRASYASGGSLGSFKSAEELSAPLAKAIADLKTGDVSDPVRLPDGVLILKVDERRESAPKPFEQVQNDVGLALVYDKGKGAEETYLKKLRAEAYIKVMSGYESDIAAAKTAATAKKE